MMARMDEAAAPAEEGDGRADRYWDIGSAVVWAPPLPAAPLPLLEDLDMMSTCSDALLCRRVRR